MGYWMGDSYFENSGEAGVAPGSDPTYGLGAYDKNASLEAAWGGNEFLNRLQGMNAGVRNVLNPQLADYLQTSYEQQRLTNQSMPGQAEGWQPQAWDPRSYGQSWGLFSDPEMMQGLSSQIYALNDPSVTQAWNQQIEKNKKLYESNQVGGLLAGEIPWQAAVGLGLLTGGALGAFGAAGSPMAAGGMLGEVGAGLGGAVAEAGGTALAGLGAGGGAAGVGAGTSGLGAGAGAIDPALAGSTASAEAGTTLGGGQAAMAGTGMSELGLGSFPTATMGGGGSSLTDVINQVRQFSGNLPPGTTDLGKALLRNVLGGGGGGTSGGGTAGGQQTGGNVPSNLRDIVGGLGEWYSAGDAEDDLKAMMERSISAADPYGYGPRRTRAADLLQQTYDDPLAIYNSPAYQLLDKRMQEQQLARDAAAGQLFNAPERVAQRQAGFLDQLDKMRQPLVTMSGANQNLRIADVISKFADPIVAANMRKHGGLGEATGGVLDAVTPTLLDWLGMGKGGSTPAGSTSNETSSLIPWLLQGASTVDPSVFTDFFAGSGTDNALDYANTLMDTYL